MCVRRRICSVGCISSPSYSYYTLSLSLPFSLSLSLKHRCVLRSKVSFSSPIFSPAGFCELKDRVGVAGGGGEREGGRERNKEENPSVRMPTKVRNYYDVYYFT